MSSKNSKRTTIYISQEDYDYLLQLAAVMSIKYKKQYTVSQIIQLLIRLLRIIQENYPDDLGYLLQSKDPEILDLTLLSPSKVEKAFKDE